MQKSSNHRPVTTRIFLTAAALAVTLVLAACGGGTTKAPDSFEGDWQGNWVSQRGAGGTIRATFEQVGNDLTGEVALTGSPCLTRGTLSGTINGSGATFGAVSGSDQITFTGNREGDGTLSGTYSVGAGFCSGDAGTFEVVKSR